MFCPKCGTQVLEGAEFCQKCGGKLIAYSNEKTQDTVVQQEHADTKTIGNGKVNSTNMADEKEQGMNNSSTVNKKEAQLGKKRLAICIAVVVLIVCIVIIFASPLIRIIITLFAAIIGIISKFKREPKKLVLGIGVIIIAGVFISFLLDGNNKESDEYILLVKNGTVNGYSQKTVGEAFDNYLNNEVWESGLSEEGIRFVNVRGEILYMDDKAELLIQFIVDEDSETFVYNACEINGVPQDDWIVTELINTIYSNDSGSDLEISSGTKNQILIGETQSYDNEFGNMEVTLDYVEFVDRLQDTWTGGYTYPEKDCVFLCAVVTVKNIGTESGSLLTAWNTIVYDGTYEYQNYTIKGSLSDIAPLTSPVTEILVFMVPNIVAESDKVLVLNINDMGGRAVISYVIRPGDEALSVVGIPNEMASAIDEIEPYEISGAYAGIWGNSAASVSMYTSGEEDGFMGNISLYLDSQMPVYGGLSIEGKLRRLDVNLFCVQYEDMEVLLGISKDSAGDIMIELYINDEYVESYLMTEQYIS